MLVRVLVVGMSLLLSIPAFGQDARQGKTRRVYFVGNSVTDTINYRGLAELAKSRGYRQVWGRHMIPGAPLQWIWQHPKDGFQETPFGHYPNALASHTWDILGLQPFDRHLEGNDGDLQMAKNFIGLAVPKSPELQVYVYARWPRQGKEDFDTVWLKKYTGGWDGTNETKDYFERLTRELRKTNPNLKKPVLMVPVGHVMYALNQEMKAGRVPGYKHIKGVFADGIHLNPVGSYVVGCTFFATLYKEAPKGLPSEPYRVTDRMLAEVIQEVVWKVVSTNDLAGVGESGPKAATRDPAAAIRTVLPEGWTIQKVVRDTYPSYRPEGKGTAIILVSKQHLGKKQPEDAIVYIMPPDYEDGGDDPTRGQAQTYPARLIVRSASAKVYLWGGRTPTSAAGWPTLKDDVIGALTK